MRNKLSAGVLAAALVFAPFSPALAAGVRTHAPLAQDDEPSKAEEAMFTRGQNFYIQGRYEQAASSFNEFLKAHPNSVITDLTLLWLGRSYMQLGRWQDAEQIGQRLRTIKDTPFIEIYESELQASRNERMTAAARPATTPAPAATPTPTPVQVAAARPTPARQTPTLTNVRPTPVPVAREIAPATTAGNAGTRASNLGTRPGRRVTRQPVAAPTPQPVARLNNTNTNPVIRSAPPITTAPSVVTTNTNTAPAVVPTPAPAGRRQRPSRRQQANAGRPAAVTNNDRQVAANTTPRTTPARPAVVPTPAPPPSSDPARDPGTTTFAAPDPTPSSPSTSGGTIAFTVKHVPALNLALRRAALAASPGQPVQLPLVVTNTSNKEDQFRIETDLPAEYQPTFSAAQGGGDTGLPIMITPQLQRGASYEVMLNLRVPDSAPDNQQRPFIVRAASQADPQTFRVTDAALTVVAAALTASANVSAETVMPGDTFTQTIQIRNQGSAAARGARADFVFSPEFELVSANPSPLAYDRPSRTAIWSLGELDSRDGREIRVTLRAVPDALAQRRALGRGTVRTQSLIVPSNFDGPSVQIGRVVRARIDAVSTGLTATPGDTVYIPFVVRNPSNYGEAYDLRITAPGAPAATIYADTNGDGRHQDGEPAVTQTNQIDPRGGQFPLLLRVDIPRNTPDRQQYAYNLVVRAVQSGAVASEASTVLTVATPRVRVRTEQVSTDVAPGDVVFYRLVLVNDGGGLAKNLVVTESLPAALEFVSSDPSLSTQDAAGGSQRFVWRVPELAPGDTNVLLVTVRLRQNVAADVTISPSHTLTYQDTNGNGYTGQ